MHSPRVSHLQEAHRVLWYLKGTTRWSLHFKHRGTLTLNAYTYSDFDCSLIEHKLTTGYCTFLAWNLITWKSKKQEVVSRSITEVQIRALAHALNKVIWIKEVLEHLKIHIEDETKIFCDNQSTINVSCNLVQHDRIKHVNINRHWIKETLDKYDIITPLVGSFEKLADLSTKGLLITCIYNLNSYPNWLIFMLILCEYDACYHTF